MAKKAALGQALAYADYLAPIFEQALKKEGLPLVLKNLPFALSCLYSKATNKIGDGGVWQLKYANGRRQGLRIDSYVDERRDITDASQAAASELKSYYDLYEQNWELALAAYACGPTNVNKAIRRAGGKTTNYWEIRQYLPRETQNYVPAFIAVNYMMNYTQAHNIQPRETTPLSYFETDTVYISKKLEFKKLASWLNMDIKTIKKLNPQYRRDYIPARMEGTNKSYVLTLPIAKISEFIANSDKILSGLTPREWELEATKD